jgi:hypothetical protein
VVAWRLWHRVGVGSLPAVCRWLALTPHFAPTGTLWNQHSHPSCIVLAQGFLTWRPHMEQWF